MLVRASEVRQRDDDDNDTEVTKGVPTAHDVYVDAASAAAASARPLVCAAVATKPDQTVTFEASGSYDDDRAREEVQADWHC